MQTQTQETVRLELRRVLASIATLAEPEQKQETAPADSAALGEILSKLEQQLASYDALAKETLENHHSLLSTGNLAPFTQSIENAIESYDFETALTVLSDMRNQLS
jgi:hypothetical protein